MIELIQIPYSPFCLVQRRILEYSGARFKIRNIPNTNRSLVWRLTRQRYYGVPIITDGKTVVFEVDEDSQVIAKYLDNKLGLSLFPREWAGVQSLIWRYVENEIEGPCFQLNDVYYKENVPKAEWLPFIRHKERKFGRGCLERWAEHKETLLMYLEHRLVTFEQMLVGKPFLLAERPLFVDFDLYGMLANFLYTGHYQFPAAHTRLKEWYRRIAEAKLAAA